MQKLFAGTGKQILFKPQYGLRVKTGQKNSLHFSNIQCAANIFKQKSMTLIAMLPVL
jgi:hypothetical protein